MVSTMLRVFPELNGPPVGPHDHLVGQHREKGNSTDWGRHILWALRRSTQHFRLASLFRGFCASPRSRSLITSGVISVEQIVLRLTTDRPLLLTIAEKHRI
jgi:hypothetical protein